MNQKPWQPIIDGGGLLFQPPSHYVEIANENNHAFNGGMVEDIVDATELLVRSIKYYVDEKVSNIDGGGSTGTPADPVDKRVKISTTEIYKTNETYKSKQVYAMRVDCGSITASGTKVVALPSIVTSVWGDGDERWIDWGESFLLNPVANENIALNRPEVNGWSDSIETTLVGNNLTLRTRRAYPGFIAYCTVKFVKKFDEGNQSLDFLDYRNYNIDRVINVANSQPASMFSSVGLVENDSVFFMMNSDGQPRVVPFDMAGNLNYTNNIDNNLTLYRNAAYSKETGSIVALSISSSSAASHVILNKYTLNRTVRTSTLERMTIRNGFGSTISFMTLNENGTLAAIAVPNENNQNSIFLVSVKTGQRINTTTLTELENVREVAFGKDRLIAITATNEVRVYDTRDWSILNTEAQFVDTPDAPVRGTLRISKDNDYFIYISGNRVLKVHINTMEILSQVTTNNISCADLSPDGRVYVVGRSGTATSPLAINTNDFSILSNYFNAAISAVWALKFSDFSNKIAIGTRMTNFRWLILSPTGNLVSS